MSTIDPIYLTSESAAARKIRSKDCTASERGQIVAHWGADKVKFWESVDSTEYRIEDSKLDDARSKGKQATADSVGYDGHKDHGAWGDMAGATLSAASRLSGTALKKGGSALTKKIGLEKGIQKLGLNKGVQSRSKNLVGGKLAKDNNGNVVQNKSKDASDVLTVILASAEVAKYIATKPNKEQYEAIMKLFESEYPQGIDSLNQAQESMQEATEETTDLTDEAQEMNDEANETIEQDKTKMDFYKAQYEALIMKAHAAANGGEPLTADEKKLLEKLAPLLTEIVAEIGDTNEEASDGLTELYDEIGTYQDRYDEGAETIAEVQGVTDYGEGFDESTRTMCYIEGAAQGINAVSAGLAAARLAAKGTLSLGATLVFAAMGTAAAGFSTKFMYDQLKMASDITEAVHNRRDVQDLEDVTTEVYDEELDNFAGNLEIIEDQEIEIPEDLETPGENEAATALAGANAAEGTGSGNPFIDAAFGDDDDETGDGTGGGAATRGSGGTNGADGGNNNGNGTDIPPEKDSAYVSKMGYGQDWTEVTEGNASRNSDDEIVTKDGKVLLTGTYCDAIKKATGVNDGEAFSKSDIPKILEALLGDPFDEAMIKKVRAGKQLDSEYAAKILKTKSQKEEGEGTVDNTKKATELAKQVIDFYYPIFEKAATIGWTRG